MNESLLQVQDRVQERGPLYASYASLVSSGVSHQCATHTSFYGIMLCIKEASGVLTGGHGKVLVERGAANSAAPLLHKCAALQERRSHLRHQC